MRAVGRNILIAMVPLIVTSEDGQWTGKVWRLIGITRRRPEEGLFGVSNELQSNAKCSTHSASSGVAA